MTYFIEQIREINKKIAGLNASAAASGTGTLPIGEVTIPDDCVMHIMATFVGIQSDGEAARFVVSYLIRSLSGVITIDDEEAVAGAYVGSFVGNITTPTIDDNKIKFTVNSTEDTSWAVSWQTLTANIILP